MINSNELRIGSIIDFDGMKSIVKEIDNQGVVVFIKETDETEWIDLFQFTPITLTEEILLKCGFKHETMFIIKNLYLIEYGDFYFALDENNGYYHVKLSNHSFGHEKQVGLGMIKYLHQIQNLYFALTGKELEINL